MRKSRGKPSDARTFRPNFRNRGKQRKESNVTHSAPLAGILFCKSCQQLMRATYSDKGSRRYRYYVCQAAREKGWKTCSTKSVSLDADFVQPHPNVLQAVARIE